METREAEPSLGWTLNCIASTKGVQVADSSSPDSAISTGDAQQTNPDEYSSQGPPSNYFKSAEWSADGTTIITNSGDNCVRSYILPPNLLEDQPRLHPLAPYQTVALKEPVYAVAGYPFFTLSDPSTTVFLSSVRDHPIQLNSALYPGIISSYSLISPTTEAFITPHSILYPSSLGGTKFLTGSDSLICLFDVSRPGKDGPVSMLPTIPSKRKKIVGGGVGMKGIVSSMAENPAGDGILAAGTFTRHVGLYAAHGSGDTIATFSVADTDADQDIGGKGITQVLWSPCGRYLYVVERMSDGVLVYDIRVTGQLVGWLKGRKAVTNQRMKVDVVAGSESGPPELWAGGTDGVVRMWTDPSTASEGTMPAWEMQAHSDAVSSAVVHPMGGIIATCSGQKHFPDFGDEVEVPSERKETSDNSLQIWWLQ